MLLRPIKINDLLNTFLCSTLSERRSYFGKSQFICSHSYILDYW
ncbi:hypothetical protein P8452_18770 [Trifolium repens]|nr:hypothetical protein P8452_18770 [Trifolium repens]